MGIQLPEDQIKNIKQKNEFVILYYGGLGSERNYKAAIQVIDAVNSIHNLSIKLKIIGSNPPLLLKKIAENNEKVTLLGFVENIADEFQNIDLAVIPFEGKYGFRSRIIELMHYGIPILTTSDSVWGMGFKHNFNILIYDNNLPHELETSLIDYKLRNAIAVNAKKTIEEEFTFEKTYQKFASDLHKIIENNHP